MGILTAMLAAHTQEAQPSLRRRGIALDMTDGRKSPSGVRVSANSAFGLSAYFAAIRAISEDIAKLPLNLYESIEPRGKQIVRDNPVHQLIHSRPNDDMSSLSFRETLTGHALGWGNGYAEIVFAGSIPESMHPIHPSRVDIARADDGRLLYLIKNNKGLPSPIEADSMFHLHGFGSDGIMGYSVLTVGALSIGDALGTQMFGAAFYGNAARPSGILEHPGVLTVEATDKLRQGWGKAYSGVINTGKTVVLEEGMTYKPISIPPEEAQLLQTRSFHVVEMARWFRIPPHKLQELARATNNNIESQAIEYVTDTLLSWGVRWEQEISRKLIAESDQGRLFAKHVFQSIMRGDQKARADFYTKRFNIGSLSVNDIRELEDENGIGPAGDTYFVQGNLLPIDVAARGEINMVSNRNKRNGGGQGGASVADIHRPSVEVVAGVFERRNKSELENGKALSVRYMTRLKSDYLRDMYGCALSISNHLGGSETTAALHETLKKSFGAIEWNDAPSILEITTITINHIMEALTNEQTA